MSPPFGIDAERVNCVSVWNFSIHFRLFQNTEDMQTPHRLKGFWNRQATECLKRSSVIWFQNELEIDLSI